MPSADQISQYYDDFSPKLLQDFAMGNPRLESAIEFTCSYLMSANCKTVLDLGFGMGWSSFEIARALNGAEVQGVDISMQLVEIASAIFNQFPERLRFDQLNLANHGWSKSFEKKFEACVMLDVYEHIPRSERKTFHDEVSSILSNKGLIILSCPTPLHQDYLRKSNTAALQPVDEDVTLLDLIQFADQIGGTLISYEYKSIWATHDYLHAVIARAVERRAAGQQHLRHHNLTSNKRFQILKRAKATLGKSIMDELKRFDPSFSGKVLRRLESLFSAE